MKIGTPELKTKPATKYFDHGYFSFKTVNKELFYGTTIYDQRRNPFLFSEYKPVKDLQHLKDLLAIKTIDQLMGLAQ